MGWMQLSRNLQPANPHSPVNQRAAGSLPGRKVILECDLENDSVKKLLFLKGYFPLGSSPQHIHRSTCLAAAERGGGGRKKVCLGAGNPTPQITTGKTAHGNASSSRFKSYLYLAVGFKVSAVNLTSLIEMMKVAPPTLHWWVHCPQGNERSCVSGNRISRESFETQKPTFSS